MNIMIVILATCCTTIEQPQCANVEQLQCILTFKNKAVASIESDLEELIVLSSSQPEHSIAKQIRWSVIKKAYIPPLPRPKS